VAGAVSKRQTIDPRMRSAALPAALTETVAAGGQMQ
jgi:hypothetical protein